MARERRRRGRLSRSGDFDRVFREGRSHGNRFLVVYAFPRERAEGDDAGDDAPLRLGISVGRKVGEAVDRNRVKRVLREAFWSLADGLPAGYDFVVLARPELAQLVEREGMEGARTAIEQVVEEGRLSGGQAR